MSSQEVPEGTPALPFLHLFSRANKRNITHHLQGRLRVGGITWPFWGSDSPHIHAPPLQEVQAAD